MQILNYKETLPSNYTHYFLGDEHIGNIDISDDGMEKIIEIIKSKKNSFWSSGGDQLESITPNDKRFEVSKHTGKYVLLSQQRDTFIDLFEPIADKGLWILDGNHEMTNKNTYNPTKDIAKGLNMDYGTYLTKANMGDFKILDWHGYGSVNSRAGDHEQRYRNDCIVIKRKLRDIGADCLVNIMHHIHKTRIQPPTEELLLYDVDGNIRSGYSEPIKLPIGDGYYIREEKRWYASSGAFLRTYTIGESGYGERFGFPPTEISFVKMTVKNDKMVGLEEVRL